MTMYATPLGANGITLTVGYTADDGTIHGSRRSYNNGCRCDDCTTAESEYSSQYRATRRRATRPVIDHDITWMDHAACHNHPDLDTDAWFPGSGRYLTRRNQQAQQVCQNDCPVRARCEQYAHDHGETGIWGGQRLHGDRTVNRRRKQAGA